MVTSATSRVSDVVDEKYGRRRSFDSKFKGPIHDRGCTDVLCLILFVAFIIGWAVVGVMAFSWGNPLKLIYPTNSKGEICGKGDYADKPFLLFFDLTRCLRVDVAVRGCPTPQVCVKTCPNEIYSPWGQANLPGADEAAIKAKIQEFCSPQYDETSSLEDLVRHGICPAWIVPSTSLLGRCVPSFKTDSSGQAVENDTVVFNPNEVVDNDPITGGKLVDAAKKLANLLNAREYSEKILSDLKDSWWIILLGLLAATGLAFLWIVAMRFVAAVMVWSSLILTIVLLGLSCAYTWIKYDSLKNFNGTTDSSIFEVGFTTDIGSYADLSSTWLIFFIGSVVLLVLILLFVVCLFKRIRMAVELIEEAAIAVGSMFSTLFWPLIPFLFEIFVVAWFFIVAVFLASSGEPVYKVDLADCDGASSCTNGGEPVKCGDECDPNDFACTGAVNGTCEFYRYGPTETANWLQFYNLFGFFWLMFFVSALDEMVLAGAFASWYWVFDKRDVPRSPLLSSFFRTLRYHVGTLAFGALIIAIIRMIRVLIEYVEDKLKEYHQDNPVVKALLCCCKCCFYCLEKFMKFINRNAYVMTAVYGKNFCWSAKEAFMLLMRNILRVFVLDKVSDFVLLLGKLVIVGTVGVLSYYVFGGRLTAINDELPELNYYFVPIIIITLGAYLIADTFFDVYAMAVDTLFLCFLEDIERNDGSPEKPYYMPKDLQRIFGYKNKKSTESPNK